MNKLNNKIKNVLNLEKLPLEEQEEMILRVGALIYHKVLRRAVLEMSEDKKDEFDKLLDKNPKEDEVFQFLSDNVKDFGKLVDEEAVAFKDKAARIMKGIGE